MKAPRAAYPQTATTQTCAVLAEAERIESELHGPHQAGWADHLERQHDNLRAALAWVMRSDQRLLGLRLPTTLRYFWYMQGHTERGASGLRRCWTCRTA